MDKMLYNGRYISLNRGYDRYDIHDSRMLTENCKSSCEHYEFNDKGEKKCNWSDKPKILSPPPLTEKLKSCMILKKSEKRKRKRAS